MFFIIALIIAALWWRRPLFLIGKLILWLAIFLSAGQTLKAYANFAARTVGFEEPYQLPLRPEVLLMTTDTKMATLPGVTRNQRGHISGVQFTIKGVVINQSKRDLDGIDVRCRWRIPNSDSRSAIIDIPLTRISSDLYEFAHTYKSQDNFGSIDFNYNCYVDQVREKI